MSEGEAGEYKFFGPLNRAYLAIQPEVLFGGWLAMVTLLWVNGMLMRAMGLTD